MPVPGPQLNAETEKRPMPTRYTPTPARRCQSAAEGHHVPVEFLRLEPGSNRHLWRCVCGAVIRLEHLHWVSA